MGVTGLGKLLMPIGGVVPADGRTPRFRMEAELRDEYLATSPDTFAEDSEDKPSSTKLFRSGITLQQQAKVYLERLKAKTDKDQKSRATYLWYDREFRLGLIPS
jgi:hypothetical protein